MVTRCAATRHAVVVDRCVVADHSAAAGRCVVVGLDAAADHFVGLALQIGAFHDVALVEIRVALNVARSVVPNAVRRFSSVDFRSVALAVAPVAARLVVQIAAQVVILETTRASQVVRCAAHSAARCAAAGSLLPAVRAGVSQLLPASPAAHSDPADPVVLQAHLT